ncbi:hypothetical protein OF829_03205 [Sphingomonas sp. LB-2]|nr:hypothetical protein [Sphingomonas caeni]
MTRSLLAIAIAAILPVSGPSLAQTSSSRDGPAPRPQMAMASIGPMTPAALMTIVSSVSSQLQPCADRQIVPAPEAGEIIAVVQLNLNRDGSLASFRILDHNGVTEANQRYVPQVDAAVEAIFTGCTPLRGLPPELYDVPRGWRSLKFRYRLKA